jgi:hypothetical protein
MHNYPPHVVAEVDRFCRRPDDESRAALPRPAVLNLIE